jgi:hypothetical protein
LSLFQPLYRMPLFIVPFHLPFVFFFHTISSACSAFHTVCFNYFLLSYF